MMAALPDRLAPLADAFRANGGWVISTHFTLIPVAAANLHQSTPKALRPFLAKGISRQSFGHGLVM